MRGGVEELSVAAVQAEVAGAVDGVVEVLPHGVAAAPNAVAANGLHLIWTQLPAA